MHRMDQRILLIGGSRGIGLAAAEHLVVRAESIWCVSRSPSPYGKWVQADVGTPEGIEHVVTTLAAERLDALLYLGGTWEDGAFTSAYSFENSHREELDRILAVNLAAPIKLVHGLLPALRRSSNPRVLLIGSLSGLDNAASREVANSASKYGLRGAAQALAKEAPDVPVTVINPGNVATLEVESDIVAGRFAKQTPIPLTDLLATIDYALALSPASFAAEINLAQTNG